eukprot:15363470-Heterocapsa_arctica.AAC.1
MYAQQATPNQSCYGPRWTHRTREAFLEQTMDDISTTPLRLDINTQVTWEDVTRHISLSLSTFPYEPSAL